MTRKQIMLIGILVIAGIIAALLLILTPEKTMSGHDDHGEAADASEYERGPHGGRLISEGDFALEMTIFETGVPPVFRVYAFDNGKPVDPSRVGLKVAVHRIAGRVDDVRFKKEADYLLGDKVVEEPHSFTVMVNATYKGASYSWEYASLEGRVQLPLASLMSAGVRIATAGPAVIKNELPVIGKIVPNEERMLSVRARFPGVVRDMRKRLGDAVRKGDLIAVVESNESLKPYEVRADMSGTIIERKAAPGESVTDNQILYVIADLGSVWVDLSIYRKDFGKLRKGQTVSLRFDEEDEPVEAVLSYISPFGAENTQTLVARAVLDNRSGAWRPGLFVKANITLESIRVPVAVETEALQTFRDWDVVFRQDGDLYEVLPLELGRSDGQFVEVVSGMSAGTPYVSGNSFLLKAELGKTGASHDH